MVWQAGQSGNPKGKKVGTKNKTSHAAAQAVLDTLHDLGGATWLKGLAKSDTKAYCMLLGKILPKEMKIEGSVAVDFSKTLQELEAAAKAEEAGK